MDDTFEGFHESDDDHHWHKKVITAVMARSSTTLEKLLEHPASHRQSIIDHSEDIIATISIVCRTSLSEDLRSSLEMLMYILCEYGNAAELVMYFSSVFIKEEHTSAEVEFFLPNIQATLLRLNKFRLFWLSSVLTQLDDYVGDFDWNSQEEDPSDNFDHLLRMQALVCDFVAPFVEDVKLSRTTFTFPAEKNYSEEATIQKYRECLGRSLLHLLAAPLGVMPVSFAKGFASYTRIVALLGQVVPDYTVFLTWNQRTKSRPIRFPVHLANYSTTSPALSTSRFHLEDSLNEKFKERIHTSYSVSTDSTADSDPEASQSRSSRSDSSSAKSFSSSTSDDSHEEPSGPDTGRKLKNKILKAGLNYVPEYGWTVEALAKGAEESGLPSITHGLCPNGGLDLVIFAYDQNNREFEQSFEPFEQQKTQLGLSFKDYLVSAIRARLELHTAYGNDWRDAIALLSLPQNTRQGLRLVGQLADDIWHLLGDNKIDSNWYAKRIAVIALYQSTELYMLQDDSEGYQDTWDFLDRRAEDFVRLHNNVEKVQKPILNAVPFLQAASITISNMLGWNQRRTF